MKRIRITTKTFLCLLWGIGIGLSLFLYLPFLILSFYVFPRLDDWWCGVEAKAVGAVSAAIKLHFVYHSRLLADYIIGKIMSQPNYLVVYQCFFIATYTALIIGILFIAHELKKSHFDGRSKGIYLFAVSALIYWLYKFHITQELFWLASYVTYVFASLLMTFFVYFLLRYFRRRRFVDLVGFVLFSIGAMFCNEVTAMFVISSLTAFLLFHICRKTRFPFRFYLAYALSLAAFLFVATAPGNVVRQKIYAEPSNGKTDSLSRIMDFGYHIGTQFLFRIDTLVLILTSVLLFTTYRYKKSSRDKMFELGLGLCLFLIIPVQFYLIQTQYNILVYPRTVYAMYFFITGIVIYNSKVLADLIGAKVNSYFSNVSFAKETIVLSLVCLILVLQMPRALNFYSSISCFKIYRSDQERRIALIESAVRKELKSVEVEPLRCIPEVGVFSKSDEMRDIGSHPQINFEKLYGVDIRVR